MSNHPQCVITGCEFFSPQCGKWVHGDLFKVGRCFVFICCMEANEDGFPWPSWNYGIPDNDRRVIAAHESEYLEKRGIITFDEKVAEMNDVALVYVEPKFRTDKRPRNDSW